MNDLSTFDSRFDAVVSLRVCHFALSVHADRLVEARFLPTTVPLRQPVQALASEAVRQIDAWLADGRFRFDLPMALSGTPFQRRVWALMCELPPGQPITYGEAAALLDSSPRAVGGACGRNPLPLIVPCHRIVGRHGGDGFMQGQQAWALGIKRWLLAHEDGVA